MKIRHAITDDALVFVACFSTRSVARVKTYQNEELLLAVEQLRMRRPDNPWLIPVRFDDCVIPDLDLGGGRTLASIQHVDLFGNRHDVGIARLVTAVLRLLDMRSYEGRAETARRVSQAQLAAIPDKTVQMQAREGAIDELMASGALD